MLKAYHKNDMTFGHISGGQSCETEEGNFYVHLYMFFFLDEFVSGRKYIFLISLPMSFRFNIFMTFHLGA